MNKDNAKDYLPLVQALAEGKTIEFREKDWQEWGENDECFFFYPPACYRIKPSPSYRAWTCEEVPIGAVVCSKDGLGNQTIAGKHQNNGGAACLSLDYWVDLEKLLANYTLLDGKPCGVAI